MTDVDPFERGLQASLRSYASEAPMFDDPAAVAQAVALEHPRRQRWLHRPVVHTIGWVFLAAALVLATVVALVVGGGARRSDDPVLVQRNPMPAELFSVRRTWLNVTEGPMSGWIGPSLPVPFGAYSFDVNDAYLLRGPEGEPLDWAGKAVEFVPIGEAGDLVVRAAGPCGEGRYTIRADSSPAVLTGVPGMTTLRRVGEGSPFVLIPVADDCPGRVTILTAGPWEPADVELVAGQRFGSMNFAEPFEFVMPVTDPTIPLAHERSLTKGVLRIGNGYSWTSSFHDDVPVHSDPCDTASAMLEDIPVTPEAVGAWLRSSGDLVVEDPIPVKVDGRTALAFATMQREGCRSFDPPLGSNEFSIGGVVYAIPTGDDTILYVVGGDGGDVPSDAVVADELVRSIRFR